MNRNDEALQKFLLVRDSIGQVEHPAAYRMAYKKPFRFYLEHSTDEAIKILIEENEQEEKT